jgi:hypothetical protein
VSVLVHDPVADLCAECYADPLRWVEIAYPWGDPGALKNERGPDPVQAEFLESLGNEVRARGFDSLHPKPAMPILMAESSGHGTGKSVLGAWIAGWELSTRPFSQGTVTAGTAQQLEERTWAKIQEWTKLCVTASWFDIQSRGIYSKQNPEAWKVQAQTCKEENAQSFAGQHAANSTSWYLFDEASDVPDAIWDTAMGGLTDGEPHFFAWGQPVRNTGRFYQVCFGLQSQRWNHRRVDSRKSRFTNKSLIDQWITDHGIDSDFVRVRVLGLPPNSSELQFIDRDRVSGARKRVPEVLRDEPLVAGLDVGPGGSAWSVLTFRRGFDARSRKRVRISGEKSRDRALLIGICAEALRDKRPANRIAALFVDSAFGAAIVERLHVLGFDNVHEVNFGGACGDRHYKNRRAQMWGRCKDWLVHGAIPDEDDLELQLTGPGFHLDTTQKLVLEPKEEVMARCECSCMDDADSLCLTFAGDVNLIEEDWRTPEREVFSSAPSNRYGGDGWMRP